MKIFWSFIIVLLSAFLVNCSTNKSNDAESAENEDTPGDEDDTSAGSLALDNALSTAYPEGLDVTAFSNDTSNDEYQSNVGSLSINYQTSLAVSSPEPAPPSLSLLEDNGQNCANSVDELQDPPGLESGSIFESADENKSSLQKAREAKERLSGEKDCFDSELTMTMKRLLKYSLRVNLDGTGCYRPDWGILSKNYDDTDEICMVGFTRNEIAKLGSYVDFSQLLIQGMICQAKKDGKVEDDGLSVDETLDLAKSIKSSVPKNSDVNVKEATIGRLKNVGSDDRAVYRSYVKVGITGPDPEGNATSFDLAILLTHSPSKEGNTSYDGVISIEHDMPTQALGPQASGPMTRAISLTYARDNEEVKGDSFARLQYEFRGGEFKKELNVFDNAGVIDFNKHADFVTNEITSQMYGTWQNSVESTQEELPDCVPPQTPASGTCKDPNQEGDFGAENGFLQRMNRITFDGYPDLGVNKISYFVNFGGLYYESARGFIFNTELVDGQLQGCGVAGASSNRKNFVAGQPPADTSIRRAINEGKTIYPRGYWRPFICDQQKQQGPEVWRQCFVKNSDGKFAIDIEKTDDRENGFDFLDINEVDSKLKSPPPTDRFKQQKWGDVTR